MRNKKDDKIFSFMAAVWVIAVAFVIIRLLIGYNNTNIEVNAKEVIHEDETMQRIEKAEKKYSSNPSVDKEYLPKLVDLCKTNPRALPILERYDEYPQRILKLVTTYNETIQFVVDYPEKKNSHVENIDVSSECECLPDKVPLFIQWDEKWGYEKYANGLMAYTACGPTCVSMLETYFKGACEHNPKEMVEFAIENGYEEKDKGTKWSLMTQGVRQLGLTSQEVFGADVEMRENKVKEAIQEGKKIICSVGPGYFTEGGHFLIITDYDNGKVSINDPNSRKNSQTMWDFKDISSQIKMMWIIGK